MHGPAGEGKTFQCQAVLDEVGVDVVLVSGGQMEDRDAGAPAALVRSSYKKASDVRRGLHGRARAAVVLINDLDAAVGDWGDLVQYTVNRQTVLGQMMHLADYPHDVEGEWVHRSAIIVTGNDFTKLYQPIVRVGRMALFEWTPLPHEKAAIVGSIFPELPDADCLELVRRFPSQPTAFFAQLRHGLREDVLWQYICKRGAQAAIADLVGGRAPVIRDTITLENLTAAASAIEDARALKNHLEP